MRIGIDGSSILPRRTGIGHYTSQLIAHLAEIDTENQYIVFLNSFRNSPKRESWMERDNFTVRRGKFPGPVLLYMWRWLDRPPVERFVGEVDVFHSPASYVPPQRNGGRVTTVHDLYFMQDPRACDRLGGGFLAATLPRRLKGISSIIAASRHTRDDLVEMLGVPSERISIVYEGVDQAFRRVRDSGQLEAARKRYRLPERFILFVGTIEPRKNISRLVEAYAGVRGCLPDPPDLVIAGGRAADAETVDRAIDLSGVARHVHMTGYVAHEDLAALYSLADLFVLPSLYEGFGLPVLEAMKCGVPVVAGDTSSLRELVADRGFLVDPEKPHAITEGIVRALSDEDTTAEYVAHGRDFAREMTWERCAQQTLAVYEKSVQTM